MANKNDDTLTSDITSRLNDFSGANNQSDASPNDKNIEEVETTGPVLNEEFFDFIQHHLALALGPIAEFLIEDELLGFGDHPEKVPFYRAAELVNLLAHHIPRPEKRVAFQKAMAKNLKETKP